MGCLPSGRSCRVIGLIGRTDGRSAGRRRSPCRKILVGAARRAPAPTQTSRAELLRPCLASATPSRRPRRPTGKFASSTATRSSRIHLAGRSERYDSRRGSVRRKQSWAAAATKLRGLPGRSRSSCSGTGRDQRPTTAAWHSGRRGRASHSWRPGRRATDSAQCARHVGPNRCRKVA